jgi:hypothetical protein
MSGNAALDKPAGVTGATAPTRFLSQPVEISPRKARDYLLNVGHRDGGPKARFFIAKGFSRSPWRTFAKAVARHPIDNPIQETEVTEFGLKVMVRCRLEIGGRPGWGSSHGGCF